MGSKVSAPKPSAEERELQKQQSEMLKLQQEIIRQQQAQNQILLPFLAEQEGFDIEMDEAGNIKSISKRHSEDDVKRREIESALLDRSLKALKGELPVDPALEEGLGDQERALRERLTAQFGPGYETSSAGIETMGEFFRSSEILRAGARTDQLTLAEQLGIMREQQNTYDRHSSMDVLRQSAIGDPMTFAGAFGQIAKGYGQAQVPHIQNRQMQLQASIANAQSSASMFGAGIGLVGALFSDDRLKTELVQIGVTKDNIPIYEYTFIPTGERLIGVLSSEVEAVRPELIGTRDGYDVVQYGGL